LIEAGLFGLGFGLGVLLTSFQNRSREKDMLDRISWRNPEDYFFMKWQREKAAPKKPSFKIPFFEPLTKEPVTIPLDAERKSEEIKTQIENQISAKEETTQNYNEFMKHRETAAAEGIPVA